jgi:hypothetical protein
VSKKRKLNEDVPDDDPQDTPQIIFDDFHDTVLMDIKPTQNATVTQDDDPQPIPDEVLAQIDKSSKTQALLRDRNQMIWHDVNPIVENSEEEEEEVLPSNTNFSPNFSTTQKSTQCSSGGRFGIRQERSYNAPRVQQGSNFDDTKKIRKSVMKRVQPVIDFFRGKKKKQEETVEEQEDDEDYQEDEDKIEDQESSSLQNSEKEEEEFVFRRAQDGRDEEEIREKQRKEEHEEKKRKEKTRKEHQNINNQLHERRNSRLREIQKEQKKIRKNLSGNSQRSVSPDVDSAEELQAGYDRRLTGNFRRQERRDVSRGMSQKDAAFKKVALMDNVRHMRRFGKPSPTMQRLAKKPKKRRGPSREQIRRRQQEAQRREQYRRRQEEIQRARRNALAQLQAVRAAMVRDCLDHQYARKFHNSNQERRRANRIWLKLLNNFPETYLDTEDDYDFCIKEFPEDLVLSLDEEVLRKIYEKLCNISHKNPFARSIPESRFGGYFSRYCVKVLDIKFDADKRREANRRCNNGLNNFPSYFYQDVYGGEKNDYYYLIDFPDDAIQFLNRDVQKKLCLKYFAVAKENIYSRGMVGNKFIESFQNASLNDLYKKIKAEEKLEELEREKRRLQEEERQWKNNLNES